MSEKVLDIRRRAYLFGNIMWWWIK